MAVSERSRTSDDALELLLDWRNPGDQARHRRAGVASVVLHALAIGGLMLMPPGPTHPVERLGQLHRIVTPLVAPPTQREPAHGQPSKEFNVESLRSREAQVHEPAPVFRRPTIMQLPTPGRPKEKLPEPPKTEALLQPPLPMAGLGTPLPPPPQIQAEERPPKIAFETPGMPGGNPSASGQGKIPVPTNSVEEAIRQLSKSGRAGALVVGDPVEGTGGFGPGGIDITPSPGKTQSAVQLLSDPLGVDFKPYLIQVLAAVRRNWRAVIPESARLGQQRGRVSVQFAIARNGYVVKLVFSSPSGNQALDRAAVSGISLSNPFPPLPGDFKGDQVRLQLTFLYNIK